VGTLAQGLLLIFTLFFHRFHCFSGKNSSFTFCKTLNSNEKILLLLGCSRFWYLGISWLYSFLLIIYPYCFCVPLLLESLAGFQSFFDCSNIWLSACLCVLYCKKIANFSNSFFIYLKLKIDKIVPWFLLGSVLLAFVFSILVYHICNETQCNNRNYSRQGYYLKHIIRLEEYLLPIGFVIGLVFSTSLTAVVFSALFLLFSLWKHKSLAMSIITYDFNEILFFSSFFLLGFGYAVSFMAVIFSAVFLLFSLWKHKQKMQTNSMKDLSVEAHIRAMKSILSFLVMYSINFVCLVLILFYIMANVNIVTILANIYVYGFPGVHSVVLILSNPQLEKALVCWWADG
uniref:Taste receptor type 2 n=1 Tax=Catharus ustulatus TaxID=91951 RepID=A0A8C3TYQ9_CATUS